LKTRRAVLAGGLMAGLSALPLTASAADAVPAPSGSASAAALSLTISTVPLKTIVNTVGSTAAGAFSWQTVTGALQQLQQTLCPTGTGCPLGLTIPTDLPDSLTVRVAQAEDNATLSQAASDVVAGHSDSTPVSTDWAALNADISALESQLSSYITGGTTALTNLATDPTALTSFLTNVSSNGVSLNLGPLGVAKFNILGTVAANLNQKGVSNNPFDSATAVDIQNIGQGVAPAGSQLGFVTVDPFQACAANSAVVSKCSASAPQVSASNNIVSVGLPDLLGANANLGNLQNLAGELKSLINLLSQAIADPTNAGSILTGGASSLPSPLSGPISTLGGILSGAVNTVTTDTGLNTVDLTALKTWDTKLNDTMAALTNVIDALSSLKLPDVTKLVTSANDLATSKTTPMAGGGVASMATSTLGSVSILPIGGSLMNIVNTAIGTSGLSLKQVTASTPLLQVTGINSEADASVGPKGAGSENASSGLGSVSILGQTINLDDATTGTLLAPGSEINIPVTIPVLGTVTLDITRGVKQVVADTSSYREVRMAALDITLTNGYVGCQTSTCKQPLQLGGAGTLRAAAPTSTHGIAALGPDGLKMLDLAAPVADAAASMTTLPPPGGFKSASAGCEGQVCLAKTGMLGGNALPAGLLLIAVAISLRLLPSLRLKLRRVR